MLVIDRVELHIVDQVQQMREFDREHAVGLEQDRGAGDEIVDVGHMGQHVLGGEEIGAMAVAAASRPRGLACRRTRTSVGTPLPRAAAATLAAGSIPGTGMPSATKYCSR